MSQKHRILKILRGKSKPWTFNNKNWNKTRQAFTGPKHGLQHCNSARYVCEGYFYYYLKEKETKTLEWLAYVHVGELTLEIRSCASCVASV